VGWRSAARRFTICDWRDADLLIHVGAALRVALRFAMPHPVRDADAARPTLPTMRVARWGKEGASG